MAEGIDPVELRRARLKLKHLERSLRALRELQALVASETGPSILIRKTCDILVETWGYQDAWLALGDGYTPARSFAHSGRSDAFSRLGELLLQGSWPPCTNECLASETGFASIDPQTCCVNCPVVDSHSPRSTAVVLLRRGPRPIGMIGLSVSNDFDIDEDERTLVIEIASNVAFALHAASTEGRRAQAARETETLFAALRAVLTAESFEAVARTIFELCKQQTGATTGYVALRQGDDDNAVLFVDPGGAECLLDPSLPVPLRGLRADAYRQVRTVFENDFESTAHPGLRTDAPASLQNVMFVPIPLRGRVEGIIGLANKAGNFTDDDARRAATLGEVAAIAYELERAQQSVAHTEQQLLATGRLARVGGWEVDLVTGDTTWSTVTKEIHEVPPDYLPDIEKAFSFFPASSHPRLAAAYDAATTRGEPYDLQVEFITAKGNRLHVRTQCTPIVECGEVVRLVGTFQDITDQKRVELEARRSEALHRRAQRVAKVGHWELASPDAAPVWSDEIYRIFGLDPQTAAPSFTQHDTIIHPDEWPKLDAAIRDGFEHAAPFDLVFKILRSDGEIAWMHAIGEAATDEHGTTTKMFGTAQDITRQRSAEETLRASATALAEAQQLSRIGSWSLGAGSRGVEWSRQMFEIFQRDPALGPLSFAELAALLHPDAHAAFEQAVAGSRKSGTTFDHELRAVRADGSELWLRSIGRPLTDAQGRITGVRGTVQDITERKAAEDALRIAHERLHLAAEAGDVGLWDWDIETNSVHFSPQWKAQLGYGEDALDDRYEEWEGRLHPDDRVHTLECLEKSLRPPWPRYSVEFRLRHKNGFYRWIHARGSMQFDRNGNPTALVGTHTDITERRQVEDHLKQSESEYRDLFLNSPVAKFTIDASTGVIGNCNQAAATLVGASRDALFGRPFWDLFPRSDSGRSKLEEINAKLHAGEPVRDVILDIRAGAESTRQVILYAEARLAAEGNVGALRVVLLDITERRKSEARLAQADRLASVGTLAAGIAHEINNPLAYVLYNIDSMAEDLPQLLNDARRLHARFASPSRSPYASGVGDGSAPAFDVALADDVLDRFRDAREGARRIRDIARRLSSFSRVEKEHLAPVDVNRAISAAVNMAQNEVRYRARLVKRCGPIPPVTASEGRLAQVFLNLIINAAHAIEDGDADNNEIRICTRLQDDTVIAEVRDTGCGIPPENLEKVFDAFFTTKEIGQGSGLGLAISRSIVESYGGTISVASEVGAGTRVEIRLPAGSDVIQSKEERPRSGDESRIRGRVLVVDDEERVRAAIVRLLRGADVVQAANGAEGKTILERDQAYDLILCDMMMPEMSGMDLHAWLMEAHPALAERVVFITGGAFTPRTKAYLDRAANRTISKPFSAPEVKKTLSDVLASTREPLGSH